MSNYVAKPRLGFAEAVKLACGRLGDFNGRSRRSEYWWFYLAYGIGVLVVASVLGAVLPLLYQEIVSELLALLLLAVTVRRLQDTGKSRWWAIGQWLLSFGGGIYIALQMEDLNTVNPDPGAVLALFSNPVFLTLMFLNFVVSVCILIFTLLDSKPGENQYGESPKYIEQAETSLEKSNF